MTCGVRACLFQAAMMPQLYRMSRSLKEGHGAEDMPAEDVNACRAVAAH